jgi:NAD(P)-dependent dehydrogenase (short-subunit alcohol dehydrogenase family)
MKMAQRAVLITGSSTGIGEACTARLAAAGWKVYAGVRRPEDGDRLTAAHSGDIEPVIIDVCDQSSIDAAIAHIIAEGAGLDALVNNAGVSAGGPVEILDIDDWRGVFETNFFGLLAMTKAAFPLIDTADGRFVHIGSINGRVAAPGLGPYAATKHAVAALNWSLRGELARIGPMTSSVVEPGEIKTAIWGKAEQQLDDATNRLERAGLTERYRWLMDMFHGFLAEANEKAIEPDKVAVAVEHALTSKRPKARYLVGTDAKIQSKLALLPDRAREFALGKAQDLLIKNGKKIRTGES